MTTYITPEIYHEIERRERIAQFRDKVRHGYNLLAAEAREVFEHYGEPIEPSRKRCERCTAEGDVWVNGMWEQCAVCNSLTLGGGLFC